MCSFTKFHRHTVNVLSALPLQCLDVLLTVRLSEGSKESGGVNMDCVHTLLLFMEKRLDKVRKREREMKGERVRVERQKWVQIYTQGSKVFKMSWYIVKNGNMHLFF